MKAYRKQPADERGRDSYREYIFELRTEAAADSCLSGRVGCDGFPAPVIALKYLKSLKAALVHV